MNEHGHGADSHMRGSARRRMPLENGTHQTPLPHDTRVTSAHPLLWPRRRAAHIRTPERGAAARRAPSLCMPKIPALLHPIRLLKVSAAAVVLPGACALLVRAAVRRVAQRQLRLERAACQRRAPPLHLRRARWLATSSGLWCICAFAHVSRTTQKAMWEGGHGPGRHLLLALDQDRVVVGEEEPARGALCKEGRIRVRGRGAPAARARPGPCRRWGRRASARSARRSAARR